MEWDVLYRGPLSGCNYACSYCPFAKRVDTREALADDAAKLERFVAWAEAQHDVSLRILFTPWGEALVRRHYQDAIVRLSHAPNVERVAIQTNLSARLDRLAEANPERVGIWATFHPTEADLDRFVAQCDVLHRLGVSFSVGVVGLREHLDVMETLRARLPDAVYLWVNAYKRVAGYYDAADLQRIEATDPLFPFNAFSHSSRGKACRAGSTAFAVDGDGNARRCHFLREVIGNVYDTDFRPALAPVASPCTAEACGCHIGYVFLEELGLDRVFGRGLLERAPDGGRRTTRRRLDAL